MQFRQQITAKRQTGRASAFVLRFVVITLVVFPPVRYPSGMISISSAEQPSPSAHASTRIDEWVSKLIDDQPRVRCDASQRILDWAELGDRRQREELLQSLLRASLTADLELQMVLGRMIEEIREREFERTLAGFVDEPKIADERLADCWQTFSMRASSGLDARHVFAKVAAIAGPSLDWESIEVRRRDPATTVLVSHLGCVAPVHPVFFQPESEVIYAQLIANRQRVCPTPVATEEARVLDRLLDATLVNNPYGWTVHQRLRLALLYCRHAVALEVADSVMRPQDRLPLDWTAAMLAFRQVERSSGWIDTAGNGTSSIRWTERIEAIMNSLEDSRTLAIQPTTRWVPMIRKFPPRQDRLPRDRLAQDRLTRGLQTEVVRTRVQDVAAWILLDRNELDARSHGMPQVEADSVWGVRQPSVGFTSDQERKLVIAKVKG